jgi:neutral ceramidase
MSTNHTAGNHCGPNPHWCGLAADFWFPASVSLCVGLFLALTGCGHIPIRIPEYTPTPPSASTEFLAGAGKVDITPPPGYPLGGHSIGGQMARGYWSRLYARAFYFQDAAGQRLALISCDLFAIPAGLHAQVAEELKLPPEQLIIAATHTHQGPAGYMSSAVFNFGGLLPGYDAIQTPHGYNETLARHLRAGIVAAYRLAEKDAREAGANGQTGKSSIVLHSGLAVNLQRNRAVDAFFRNPPADTAAVLKASQAAGMTCPDPSNENQCPRYQAADPTLHVLEVRRGGDPIALLVFYAIHNTAMSHDCTLYQSDLVGYAMHQLEAGAPRGKPLVAGFFNGAEGDISPRWVAQDRGDVVSLGGKLADAIRAVWQSASEPQTAPEISSARQAFAAVPPAGDTKELTLPGSGVGELGGAEDGRTVLYAYGWHGGVTNSGADPKKPALTLHNIELLKILQDVVGSPQNYPQRIPVSVATLGTLSLAAIPTEMTTVQGFHLRDTLQSVKGRPFVIVGLANEYIGYTATEAEYAAQDYEGSSTMYGKNQGKVLGELLKKVATAPPASPADKPQPVSRLKFDAGGKWPYRFGPELFGERYNLPYQNLEPLMSDSQGRVVDNAPRFQWDEPAAADWEEPHRSVTILQQRDGAWYEADTDLNFNILTVLVDGCQNAPSPCATPDLRTWTAIWVPVGDVITGNSGKFGKFDPAGTYVFRVEPPGKRVPSDNGDQRAMCSAPFHLGGPVVRVPADPLRSGVCPPWRNE